MIHTCSVYFVTKFLQLFYRYLVPLLQRDEFGRCVLFSNAGRFDPYKYTAADMARVHSMVVESLMDDPENQIRGIFCFPMIISYFILFCTALNYRKFRFEKLNTLTVRYDKKIETNVMKSS